MTPPGKTNTESGLPIDIDNRYLAKQLLRIEGKTDDTKRAVEVGMLAWSGLADRVTGLEHRMHDVEQIVARPPPAAPTPTRAMRWFPFFRLAAIVTLTLVGTLAIVAGLIVFTSTRS